MAGAAPVFSQVKSVKLGFVDTVEVGASTASKAAVPIVSHFAHWAPPLAAGAMAAVSEWDHHIEKREIAHKYDAEIASRLGKPISKVNIDDMEKVAKENPVIAEEVGRSRTKRNLNIGVMLVGVAAAVAIAGALGPGIAAMLVAHTGMTAGVAAFAASAVTGGLGFLGVEVPLKHIGEKLFGLKEPELKEVKRNPTLQSQQSVSSQVSYLSELQAEKKVISQEQVMQVYVSANKDLGRQIETHYGESFDQLSASAKVDAIRQYGDQFAISEVTQDLNNHHLRAQELAFAVKGQASGLQSVGDIQRANARMQQRVNQLNAQLNQLYSQQRPARTVAVVQEPQTAWRDRINAERQQAAGKSLGIA